MTSHTFVFDAYGTLFDVHAAIGRHRAATGPDAERLSELWRTKQLEYTWTLTLAGRYEDFWALTDRALDFALARFPAVDPRAQARPHGSLTGRSMPLRTRATFCTRSRRADTRPRSVERLHRHAVGCRRRGEVSARTLDAVLSVDAIRLYKPRPEAYRLVTDHFGTAPANVIFVSSNRWDVMARAPSGFAPPGSIGPECRTSIRILHRNACSRTSAG